MIIADPILELLDRGPASGEAGKAFQELYWVLKRDVDLGTHVIEWIVSKPNAVRWEVVALALYLHVIDLTDAGSVLIRERISGTCKLIARSQFETWLSLKYLLDDHGADRALAYSYCSHLESLRAAEEFIRRAKQTDSARDEYAAKVYPKMLPKALEHQTRLQEIVNRDTYADIRSEYARVTGNKATRIPKWYSLFNGPTNLRELAVLTGDEEYYVWLYKHWSGHLHGECALTSFTKDKEDGALSVEGFRNGLDAPQITLCMHTFAVGASHKIVEAVVPEKSHDLGQWYLKQGRSRLNWMSSLQFVTPQR